jgi:staphylococcal nuclease homologue
VRLDNLLVNQHLIAEGYAKEYTFKTAYSKQHEFQSAQSQAKEKKI